jgi:NAD(P)-dependent dehydrogenase (short-subunit alcohol dehydrogenase family)
MAFLNKTAVITGGSRGIGLGIAQRFASLGARVCIIGQNKDNVDAAVTELNRDYPTTSHIGYVCNVADYDQVEKTSELVMNEFERVDILVNSAGINRPNLLLRQRVQDMQDMVNVNLMGTMYTCKVYAAYMLRQRQGCIINLSSVVGAVGSLGASPYAATKAAIDGFTMSISRELGPKNIRVNSIQPGWIETDMTAAHKDILAGSVAHVASLGRLGLAADVADVAEFLVKANYVSGQAIRVDGDFHG